MSQSSKEKQAKPVEEVKVEKVEQRDPAKTPANESSIAARVAAISRKLGSNEGQVKVKGEPDPSSQARGGLIAAKFIARSIQRNS